MLLNERMVATGNLLFRWRGYVLLIFVPWIAWSVAQGSVLERAVGPWAVTAMTLVGVALLVAGQLVRIASIGFVPRRTSGRNTAEGQVAESLNTTGLYSLTRNPLYLGNCMMYLGIAAYSRDPVLVVVMALVLGLYYERIILAEERYLSRRFGRAYADWVAQVPPFLPRWTGWTPPAMPFSVRAVLRREAPSIFGAILAVYLLEYGHRGLGDAAAPMPPAGHGAMAVAAFVFVALSVIKRRTALLAVEGR